MKKIFLSFFIFSSLLILGYITYDILHIQKKDIDAYEDLINRKSELTSCEALKRKPFSQNRTNVQKDIFLNQNNSRVHFRIFAENSFLTLTEKKENIEITENLKNIKCLIQDKISFNSEKNHFEQQLRYFTAKNGTYLYPSHKFLTDTINLSFFDLPGNVLPDDIDLFTPTLKGFAKEVSFTLIDKYPEINASHFRASFDLEREIR